MEKTNVTTRILRLWTNLSRSTVVEARVAAAMADSRAARMRRYYDARAAEYDETTYELARRDPAAAQDLAALEELVASLPPGRVLDAGCGTGWLTRLLRGTVVALDASEAMLRVARGRLPHADLVLAVVPPLPFPDGSFECVLCSHLYSHLETEQMRSSFLAEAFRVAVELVVVEEAWRRPGLPTDGWEERPLRDGSTHLVYKRYLTASALASELAGEVLLETPSFVAVRATATPG
jgi:SAM-dependent methyltransferase